MVASWQSAMSSWVNFQIKESYLKYVFFLFVCNWRDYILYSELS